MIFRIFVVIIVLALGYVGYEIYYFSSMFQAIKNPPGEFQVLEPEDPSVTMVEFLDYTCPHCRDVHPVVQEVLKQRPDVRYVVIPTSVMEQPSEKLIRVALAAGLQGRFWEFNDAFLEHPGEITDDFIEETAGLYGLDYQRLMEEAQGEEVTKLFEANQKAADKATIYSTPYFVIGSTFYQPTDGVPEPRDFLRIIVRATDS